MTLPTLSFQTVETARDLRDFLDMPVRVYRDDPNWVQPLYMERKEHLSPKNPYFDHAKARLRIARDSQGQTVGRISMQVDSMAPKVDGKPEGHFGLIEAVSPAVMGALLADAEAWFRTQGIHRVVGPFSLSINDESGLLIEGPDAPPRLMMPYGPAWYAEAIEAAGYTKAKDLVAYLLDLEKELPPAAWRMAEQAKNIPGFKERPLQPKNWETELNTVGELFNDAWQHNWGYVPLTEHEVRYLGANLKPLVDRDLARFIEMDGQPVGMAIALADINEALLGLKGRLLPFGWLRLLWRMKVKRIRTARVILMGVSQAWQRDIRGAAMIAAMFVALRQALIDKHYKKLEMSWILEDNKATIGLATLFCGELEKRYRIYQKQLP